MLRVGWGGGFPDFDAEFKFAIIQNSYFHEAPPPKKNGNFSSGLDLEKLFEVDF